MSESKPYGGKLVNRKIFQNKGVHFNVEIPIDRDALLNIEQIATGAFSPLEGFMDKEDFYSCINRMKLSNGLIWPIPVILSISKNKKLEIEHKKAKYAGLFYNNRLYAFIEIEDIYNYNKKETAKKIFGTSDAIHPGVKKWISQKDYFIGGKISQIKPMNYEYPEYMFTPLQTRQIFKKKKWKTICGFQTRNVPHRGHEILQRIALQKCDGLFIQPLIGWKKKGDFKPEAIINAYNQLIKNYYPSDKILLGTLSTAMLYAGPKEAIFHAIIRKNFGCTHFIVGRDHAGVSNNGKSYYKFDAACKILKNVEKEIGINTIRVDTIYYFNKEEDGIVDSLENVDEGKYEKISGTTVRDYLIKGLKISHGLMRPEVAKVISKNDLIK